MSYNASKYNYQFTKEKYDRVNILLPKGTKQEISEKTDESINAFVNRAVRETLDRIDESKPETEQKESVLKPAFRADSVSYTLPHIPDAEPDEMAQKTIDALRERRDTIHEKREAQKRARQEYREDSVEPNEKLRNNFEEMFMNLRRQQEEREATADEPDAPSSPSDAIQNQ